MTTIRAAFILALTASPASAVCLWGALPHSAAGIADHGDRATVTVHNRITQRVEGEARECVLTFGGGPVVVSYTHGPGRDPDEASVYAPEGYVAVPPVLVLDENTTGTVEIVPIDEMQMG